MTTLTLTDLHRPTELSLAQKFISTFGYAKFKGLLEIDNLRLLESISELVLTQVYKTNLLAIHQAKKPLVVAPLGGFLQGFIPFSVQIGIFSVAKALLGDRVLYCGSDHSLFFKDSLVHSDTQSIAPTYKFSIYLDGSLEDGTGVFNYVPMSQHIGQLSADLSLRYCVWPRGGSGFTNIVGESGRFAPPAVQIPYSPGDLIVFDNRGLHSTGSFLNVGPRVEYPRRLFTWVFAPHPDDLPDHFFDRVGYSRKYVYEEIYEYLQLEADNSCRALFCAEDLLDQGVKPCLANLPVVLPNPDSKRTKFDPQSMELFLRHRKIF